LVELGDITWSNSAQITEIIQLQEHKWRNIKCLYPRNSKAVKLEKFKYTQAMKHQFTISAPSTRNCGNGDEGSLACSMDQLWTLGSPAKRCPKWQNNLPLRKLVSWRCFKIQMSPFGQTGDVEYGLFLAKPETVEQRNDFNISTDRLDCAKHVTKNRMTSWPMYKHHPRPPYTRTAFSSPLYFLVQRPRN
jgi:hypothetical protein